MSAYGSISKPHTHKSLLPTTRWTTQDKTTKSPIPIDLYHLTLETASESKSPGLIEYLHSVFARVVEDGMTYPMEVSEGEEYSREDFERYFFVADVVVGVLAGERSGDGRLEDGVEIDPGTGSPFGPSKDGQPVVWEDVIVGFYYVGPFSSRTLGKKTLIRRYSRSNPTTQADPRTYVASLGPRTNIPPDLVPA